MSLRKQLVIIVILSIFICCITGVYAFFSADVSSESEALKASSARFKMELEVIPEFNYKQLIPMVDTLAVTGYNNGCTDVNEYEVCQAYKIKLSNSSGTGQAERLSGVINFNLNRVTNMSYLLLDEDKSLYKDITSIVNGVDSSLGDYIELADGESRTLTLIIWLSDTGNDQNNESNGSFNASITYTGIRGEDLSTSITGSIN